MEKQLCCSVHCHSTYCDGKNTLAEMAQSALAQGLDVLGMSGHGFTAQDSTYCMTLPDTARYCAELTALKQQYQPNLQILCGVEWDGIAGEVPQGFDYWIGSVHYLQNAKTGKLYALDDSKQTLRACQNELFGADGIAMATAYFAEVATMARCKPTILGHFDLIKKLNADGTFFDEESAPYKQAAHAALQVARANDCVLELNTGGVQRGYRTDFYPSDFLLHAWQQLGGAVIITADAHQKDALTFGFAEAKAQLKRHGFATHAVLTQNGFVHVAL